MPSNNFGKTYMIVVKSLATEGGMIAVLVLLLVMLFVPLLHGVQMAHDAFLLVLGALLTIIKARVEHDKGGDQ